MVDLKKENEKKENDVLAEAASLGIGLGVIH